MLKRDLRGVRVGPYEIVRLLGQGATSSVFEEPDGRQGKIVTCSFETEVRWQPRG